MNWRGCEYFFFRDCDVLAGWAIANKGLFFFYRADENVYTLEFLLSAPLVKKDASEKALVENGGRYRWL